MDIVKELSNCYLVDQRQSPQEIISKYKDLLDSSDAKELLEAAARLYIAYCAAPGFSKSRQLDILAKDNPNMKILKVLIRDHDKGVVEILGAFNDFFTLMQPQEFWDFFNKRLELPNDWYDKAIINIKGEI